MAITKTQAVQGLAALMFGQAVGTATAANFREILANDPSIYNLANNLIATNAFSSQFRGEASTQDKIDLILGRLGLEEGSDSYTAANAFVNARLEAGVPAGQVVAEIGEKLLGDSIPRGFAEASEVLRDAIERSNAHLEAGNEGNVSLQLGNGVTVDLLAQAIQQVEIALEARDTFLTETAEVEEIAAIIDDAANSIDNARDAIAQYLTDTTDDLNAASTVIAGSGNFVDLSNSAQDAVISDAVAAAEQTVSTSAAELESGTIAAVNTVQARLTTVNEAVVVQQNAQTAYAGEQARFNTVNTSQAAISVGTGTDGVDELQINSTTVAVQRANGTWRVVEQDTVNVSELDGFNALLAAANTEGRAEAAVTAAVSGLDTAIEAVASLEDDTYVEGSFDASLFRDNTTSGDGSYSVDFDSISTDVGTYLTDIAALQTLTDAIAEFTEARGLQDQLDTLDANIGSAIEVITEDYDFNLQLLSADNFDDAAGEGNDLFVFDDVVGTANAITISDFGNEGTDYLYFGEGYKATALTEGQTINNRVGSADTLEIFWQQDGDNLVLYVEANEESGTDLNGDDITQITLTGVNVADVDFSNGFLSVNAA